MLHIALATSSKHSVLTEDPQRDTIVSAQVLESYNPLFELPTTGAIASNRFYFMANTQIHNIAPDGSIPAGMHFNPIHILRLNLNRFPR